MNENNRETGARILKQDRRHAEIDQPAAENKKPKGMGLTRPANDTNDKARQSEQAGSMKKTPQSDAKGAGARTQSGGSNDGVISANPKVLSGKESGDATFKHTFKRVEEE